MRTSTAFFAVDATVSVANDAKLFRFAVYVRSLTEARVHKECSTSMEFCSARVPTFSRSTSIIAVGFAIDGFAIDGGRRDQRNGKLMAGGICRRPQIRPTRIAISPKFVIAGVT